MSNDKNNLHSLEAKRETTIQKIVTPILFILSAVASLIAFTLGYNAQTGYLAGSPSSFALHAGIAIGILIAAWRAISHKEEYRITPNERIAPITSLIFHIVTVFCAVIASSAISNSKYAISGTVISVLKAIFLISAIISFLAAPALRKNSKNRDAFALIGSYALVFICISSIALLYFDLMVEMNNPQKILIQLSMASICLSEIAKVRSKIYKSGMKFQIFITHVATVFSTSAAVSALAARVYEERIFSNLYLCTAIILAAHAISTTVTGIFSHPPKTEQPAATADEESTNTENNA